MTPPQYKRDDESQQRQRREVNYDQPDRSVFISLSERVAELEAKYRMLERQHVRDIETIERRMREDFEEVKASVRQEVAELKRITTSLDKSAQSVSIAIAEIKVRSGIIGAISAGFTFFLIIAFEWLKNKSEH